MAPLLPGRVSSAGNGDGDDDHFDSGHERKQKNKYQRAGGTPASASAPLERNSNTSGRHRRSFFVEDQHHPRKQLTGSDKKDRGRADPLGASLAAGVPPPQKKSKSSPPEAEAASSFHAAVMDASDTTDDAATINRNNTHAHAHNHNNKSLASNKCTPRKDQDDTILPLRIPLPNEDGKYKRPEGRTPSGYEWDVRQGRCEKKSRMAVPNSSNSKEKSQKKKSIASSLHSVSSSSDGDGTSAALPDHIGSSLAPLRRDANGKFECPSGRQLTGCVWNGDTGQWEVDPATSTTTTATATPATTTTTSAAAAAAATNTTTLIQQREAKKHPQGAIVVDTSVSPAEAAKIRRQATANHKSTKAIETETRAAVPEQQPTQQTRRRRTAKDHEINEWFEGNGLSRDRTARLLAAAAECPVVRCHSCEPCCREACQKCGLCRQEKQQRGASKNLLCVLKCCDESDSATKAAYCGEMEAMLADHSERSLGIGHEVCCLDVDAKYFQGTITNKYYRGGRLEYTVYEYTVNRSHKRVPERTIYTIFEMHLCTEVARLKKISGNASKPPATKGDSSNTKPLSLESLTCQPASVRNAGGSGTLAGRNAQLQKGTRVLALWSGSDFYWGYIVNVLETGLHRRYYDVLFEDGDEKHGVRAEHIMTEKQFKDRNGIDPPPAIKPAVWRLVDIHRARCGICSMCQKEECGHCYSCQFNKNSTSKHRRSCILQMCQKVQVLSKALPSRYLRDWKFYSTVPAARPSTSIRFDPDVSGLRLLAPDGTEYACLEAAMRSCGATGAKSICAAIQGFADYDLGLPIRRIRDDHILIGKGYYRVWRDVTGRLVEIYGTITQCLESLCDEGMLFKVKYWDVYRALLNDAATIEDDITEVDTVNEATATGGYMAFLEKTEPTVFANLSGLPTPTTFIVPTSRSDGRDSRDFRILHGGVLLYFIVKPSLIPNAGEGLFVKATCVERAGWLGSPDAFVLKAGVFMDIGIYAPLRKNDRNSFALQQMKSFIFAHKPDVWAFDAKTFDHATLDITDNKTGNRHEQALRSILNRVNETDGTEEPNIYADYDPQGSVHYYLGNKNSGIRLDFGKEVELKIDYGDSYESVRILQNYPRLCGPELTRKKAVLARHDEETVRNFFSYSANDVQDSCLFFEEILEPKWETVELYRQRAMLAALALFGRARDIREEFREMSDRDLGNACVNGYSETGWTQTEERIKSIVRTLGSQISDRKALRKQILACDVLQAVVFKIAQVSASAKSADELFDLFCKLE